ncbi:hypothetical protein PR048_018012 [Dryococelus australis]|uniref:Uncharacterized protein n=1 Tax=Dryococelus australis TaxID=614101 RepID=A0ABQ9HBA0_9NEOP|nr:hypothetical protein PR048_018012 [Dryococelus australis]
MGSRHLACGGISRYAAVLPLDLLHEIWVALNIEILRADEGEVSQVWSTDGMQGRGKLEIPEKICLPEVSPGMILTCENLRATLPGFELGLSKWEASSLTTTPPQTHETANGNSLDSRSVGSGFDSRSGHSDFCFPWFPEIAPGECWDGSLTKVMAEYFPLLPQSLFPPQLAPSLMTSLSTRRSPLKVSETRYRRQDCTPVSALRVEVLGPRWLSGYTARFPPRRCMPLVGGFSRGSPVSPALSFRRCSIPHFTLIDSQDLAVKSRPSLFTFTFQCRVVLAASCWSGLCDSSIIVNPALNCACVDINNEMKEVREKDMDISDDCARHLSPRCVGTNVVGVTQCASTSWGSVSVGVARVKSGGGGAVGITTPRQTLLRIRTCDIKCRRAVPERREDEGNLHQGLEELQVTQQSTFLQFMLASDDLEVVNLIRNPFPILHLPVVNCRTAPLQHRIRPPVDPGAILTVPLVVSVTRAEFATTHCEKARCRNPLHRPAIGDEYTKPRGDIGQRHAGRRRPSRREDRRNVFVGSSITALPERSLVLWLRSGIKKTSMTFMQRRRVCLRNGACLELSNNAFQSSVKKEYFGMKERERLRRRVIRMKPEKDDVFVAEPIPLDTSLPPPPSGAMVAERIGCSPPITTNLVQSPAGSLRIFACGNHVGICRWLADFLGDLPFPPPLHSGAAPHSPHSLHYHQLSRLRC